jgi:LPS O-antigen subunit length determinant protein (WzzB/FepE family)
MTETTENTKVVKDGEIDLLELLRKIWACRKVMLITVTIFAVLGILYVVIKSSIIIKEYESQVSLMVDSPSHRLLQTVIKSPGFLSEVMKANLIVSRTKWDTMSVLEILVHKTNPAQGNIEALANRINVDTGEENILIIGMTMQDPFLTGQLTDTVAQRLVRYLQSYQTPRAKKKIEALTVSCLVAETKYHRSLETLSDFYKQNPKTIKLTDSVELKQLRSDCDLKFDVYDILSQQLEQAKIDAKDQVPVIEVLKAATVAKQSNKPNVKKIVLLMLFVGLIVGTGVIFTKGRYQRK